MRIFMLSALIIFHSSALSEIIPGEGEVLISFNPLSSLANDDLPDTSPAPDLDDTSYFFRGAVQWQSGTPVIGVAEDAYYGIAINKRLTDVEDEYIESCTAFAAIYGQKYYLTEHRKGAVFGWYAGGSSWDCEGYDYFDDNLYGFYEESGFSPLAAAEAGFEIHGDINPDMQFYIYPGITISLDKEFGDLEFFPGVELGLRFK